ncbi:C4-dicarboxylate ABC transporter permease [Halobacteriovorax sp. BALOs_7]|uniref:TRAP transporter small permease n=1 Tax=Halobacteriovorax sp. BALOs_7 TaxID=2109558 RepID=UPI000EA2DC5D|nr:TRAP transporter small permease [Halobacteriovorax sp. BALOs_7]AYF43868.1 C4-dicarboxylate ABC transporter permease [Halobacteriovorax sp. BALOs_7]
MKLFLKNFEEIISGSFLIIMVCLVILNVILRYLFNYSIYWAEEVSTICFVWSVFVGASAVYKNKMDIGIDALIVRLSPEKEKITRTVAHLLTILINGYIFYLSIVFTFIAYKKPTAVLGISSAVYNSALIFGFGLISFHSIKFLIEDVKGRRA